MLFRSNPTICVQAFGEEYGKLLCTLFYEMRSMIIFAAENKLEDILIRIELFIEIYSEFEFCYKENNQIPSYASLYDIMYWFISDYADKTEEEQVKALVVSQQNKAVEILKNADLSSPNYL